VNAKANNRLGNLVTTRSRTTEGVAEDRVFTTMGNRRDEALRGHQQRNW
jgi:hypothetical protein